MNYFVAAAGNDNNSGTEASPWQTIAKVNATPLNPGDIISFNGGDSFSGSINLGQSGISGSPIRFNSYGVGRATISGSFFATDKEYIEIVNLNFTGTDENANTNDGISIQNTTTSQLHHIYLTDLTITHFGLRGVFIRGSAQLQAFDDVRILRVTADHNLDTGIRVDGGGINTNVYIGQCAASFSFGSEAEFQAHGFTGNGIDVNSSNGVLVEHCLAHDNGVTHGHLNAGIQFYQCQNGTIQFCEAYNNIGLDFDGDGFDLDDGSQNCTVQYNYSHDNGGAGILLNSGTSSLWTGNVVRFNISVNNALRLPDYGEMTVGRQSSGSIGACLIYQNTFKGSAPSLINIGGTSGRIRFYNNIFQGSNGILNIAADQPDLFFQQNDYWSTGAFTITWGANSYGSLADWRAATGQEQQPGQDYGIQADPLLTSGYELQSNSPMIDAGVNLQSAPFGNIQTGNRDFFGNPYPTNLPDIGAYEKPEVIMSTVTEPVTYADKTVAFGTSVSSFEVCLIDSTATILATINPPLDESQTSVVFNNVAAGAYTIRARTYDQTGTGVIDEETVPFTVNPSTATVRIIVPGTPVVS